MTVSVYEEPGDIFESTAGYYTRFRRPHPGEAVAYVAHLARRVEAAPRMLDLGCGPGTVALPLAAAGVSVVAVDPSTEMLEAGRAAAKGRTGLDIDWRQGTGEQLGEQPGLGALAGVVVGDAFHWMNRAAVLAELDRLVLPGGFVALLCSRAGGSARPWWHETVERVRARHLGEAPAAGVGVAYVAPVGDHEQVLRASAFCRLAVLRVEHRVRYTTAELVGLQSTFAYSSPVVLGQGRELFEADLAAALESVEPSGAFEADVTAAVIVGRRA